MSDLLDAIGGSLPISHRVRLFHTFDATGEYAKAEDQLFELVESGFADVVPEGLAFYEKLLTLDDEELTRGGLPRSEVEEGSAQLRKLTSW